MTTRFPRKSNFRKVLPVPTWCPSGHPLALLRTSSPLTLSAWIPALPQRLQLGRLAELQAREPSMDPGSGMGTVTRHATLHVSVHTYKMGLLSQGPT